MKPSSRVLCFGEPLGLVAAHATAPGSSSSPATLTFAGAESNVAIGLARQGISTRYVTAVGLDWFGEAIQRTLRAEKVDISDLLVDPDAHTGLMIKQPQVLSEPSVAYYRADSAFARKAAALADTLVLAGDELLFVSGITPALHPEIAKAFCRLVERAVAAGNPICLDLNYRSKLWSWDEARSILRPLFRHCQLVFSSEEEAAALTETDSSSRASAAALLGMGAREVVIKRGPEGAVHFTNDSELAVPAFQIPGVIDPIGAGDAFDAGFIAGRVKRLPLDQCLRLGAILGAAACSFVGDWEGLPLQSQTLRLLDGDLASVR